MNIPGLNEYLVLENSTARWVLKVGSTLKNVWMTRGSEGVIERRVNGYPSGYHAPRRRSVRGVQECKPRVGGKHAI